ncbi:MAG TPA: hypothetical protein VFT71_07940 [Candidatus Nitrosocosmicus sp.]|nr:hypothetical protein [Candidatus Nitrosocosmicus sp.]
MPSSVTNEQGWGLINIGSIVNSNNSMGFVDNTTGLETGQSLRFEVNIGSNVKPLRATLVWTDYPGPSLINNLNLVMTDPQGKKYRGNVFEEPFDSRLDATNNVESIFIERPQVGKISYRNNRFKRYLSKTRLCSSLFRRPYIK